MTSFIIVRHAQSLANKDNIFAGHFDIDLTELGRKQAELAARYIQARFHVDKIYVSDLKRTCQTAEPIARLCKLEPIKTPEFREIYAGDWEGMSFEKIQETFRDDYMLWRTDVGKAAPTNGESTQALGERVWKKLEEIAKENPDKTVVIVTHATPVRAVLCRLCGYAFSEMQNVGWTPNASATVVQTDGKEWTLLQTGIDEYLVGNVSVLPPNV